MRRPTAVPDRHDVGKIRSAAIRNIPPLDHDHALDDLDSPYKQALATHVSR